MYFVELLTEAVFNQTPISQDTLSYLKPGDNVAFFDNCEIREASFLCSSLKDSMTPKEVISEFLSTEDEIRNFCKTNRLSNDGEHIFR